MENLVAQVLYEMKCGTPWIEDVLGQKCCLIKFRQQIREEKT